LSHIGCNTPQILLLAFPVYAMHVHALVTKPAEVFALALKLLKVVSEQPFGQGFKLSLTHSACGIV